MIGDTTLTTHRVRCSAAYHMGRELGEKELLCHVVCPHSIRELGKLMPFIVMICHVLPLVAVASGTAIQTPRQVFEPRAELRAANRWSSEGQNEFCERNELSTCILSNIYVGTTSMVEGASKEVGGFAGKAVKAATGEFYEEGRPFKSIICNLIYGAVLFFIGVICYKIRNVWINLKNGSRWGVNHQTIDDFCATALESKISKREKFNIWFCLLLLNISAEQWLRKRGVKIRVVKADSKADNITMEATIKKY